MSAEYFIVQGETPEDVTDEVNNMIRDGWRAQGGIQVLLYHHADPLCEYATFYQAMTRDGDGEQWITVADTAIHPEDPAAQADRILQQV